MPSSHDPHYELPTRAAHIRVIKGGDPGRPGVDAWSTPEAGVDVIIEKGSDDFEEQPTRSAEISIICVDLPPWPASS